MFWYVKQNLDCHFWEWMKTLNWLHFECICFKMVIEQHKSWIDTPNQTAKHLNINQKLIETHSKAFQLIKIEWRPHIFRFIKINLHLFFFIIVFSTRSINYSNEIVGFLSFFFLFIDSWCFRWLAFGFFLLSVDFFMKFGRFLVCLSQIRVSIKLIPLSLELCSGCFRWLSLSRDNLGKEYQGVRTIQL